MTSEEWLNRDYSKYPEVIESINNHRIFTEVKEKDGEIVCIFRFGDEVYCTKIVLSLGSKEEAKKKYLDRGIDLAYELFKEKIFKFQLRFMRTDIEQLFDTLFKMQISYDGVFNIEEVSYTPKIDFFKNNYIISRGKKNPKTGRRLKFNTVDDIIDDLKNDYYNNKSYIISGTRIKAAFCQLLDYLNKDNETE